MGLWTMTLLCGYGLVILLNLIFSFSFTTLLNLIICLAIIMLPAALFLFIGRIMPKKIFNENKRMLKIGVVKQKICKITNVKVWKDLYLNLALLTGFIQHYSFGVLFLYL